MRILHTGDVHLGELAGPEINGVNGRLLDTYRCMEHLTKAAREEKPDAILIAGDIFNRAKQWADQMLQEIRMASTWLRNLTQIAPVVLMFGTSTHDNTGALEDIRDRQIRGLTVVTEPQILTIETKSGPLQVAVVPGMDKGYFRTQCPGMDAQEENAICTKILGDMILGMSGQMDPLLPSVLMGHYTVVGCQMDNGEHVFLQNEVVLPKEALAASSFDLVALGHIHLAQSVPGCGRPAYYCGPVNRITFNEEGQTKGFWAHEVEPDLPYDRIIESRFIETPAREMLTVKLIKDGIHDWPQMFAEDPAAALDLYCNNINPVKDAIVRVHYCCDEATRKQMNHRAIEKALYAIGAFYVSEIKPIDIISTLAKQELSENSGPLENLVTWLKTEGFDDEEILAIIELARPLVDTVAMRMPTGKLDGMFIPISLRVKNYRSYKEEFFDFAKISFAIVNGENGVGKSSFFMDAIKDCLYEDTREDDNTGWISNYQKSGALEFIFAMGDTIWRVLRTRTKSGKITLALQQLIDDNWEDRSGTTTKETQFKIINLLGMDALTFSSCALIMQDQYGLFLQADRADRMEVLGNILGLGIYELLMDLAKKQVTEIRRSLDLAKAKAEDLRKKLTGKPDLEANREKTLNELLTLENDQQEKEKALADGQELIKTLDLKHARAEDLAKQKKDKETEAEGKEKEIGQHQERITTQKKYLDVEATILAKATELEEVRTQINTITAKMPQVQEMTTRREQIKTELAKIETEKQQVTLRVKLLEEELKDRTELEKAAADYKECMEKLAAFDEQVRQYNEFKNQILAAEEPLDILGEELSVKNNEITNCQERTIILADSNCVDQEKAQCNFLADAQRAKARIPVLEQEISEINLNRQPLLDKIAELESQRDAVGYDSDAHYEAKLLADSLRPKADKAAQMAGKTELLDTLNKQVEQYAERIGTLNSNLTETETTLEALQIEVNPLTELKEKLPNLEKWAAGKEMLPAAREIVKSSTESIERLTKEIENIRIALGGFEIEIRELTEATKTLPSLLETSQQLKTSIASNQNRSNELRTSMGAIESSLKAMADDETELNKVKEEIEPMAIQLVRYQTLVKAFGFDGIPFSIVRFVIPELSNMANDILAQMTGGKMSMEMKTERVQKSNKKEVNTLEIWTTDYMRGSLPYKSRSGGQKVKTALSVAFALADLKARRAGIQLGMMFVDEPPFLDAAGVDAYCDALELLSQRYPNMKVLAISHDPRMKARFPQQIEVEDMGEEGSRVRMVA